MSQALRFRNSHVPVQAGEKLRLKVIAGVDLGATYVVTGDVAVIGRSEQADVYISDLKSSRKHAELRLLKSGWGVSDLGSANGITHNTHPTKSAPIQSGDLVGVGETVFEVFLPSAGTKALTAPGRNYVELKSNIEALEKRREAVQSVAQVKATPKSVNRPVPPENRKRFLIYGTLGVVAAALYFMSDDSETDKNKKAKAKPTPSVEEQEAERNLAALLPSRLSGDAKRTTEMFYREGFREFREGNYLRARNQFETVLQIDPTHRMARLYLGHCETAIENEVTVHLTDGRQKLNAGKLSEAKGHFEAVLRLLFRSPENERYKEAQDQLDRAKKEMRGDF